MEAMGPSLLPPLAEISEGIGAYNALLLSHTPELYKREAICSQAYLE